MQPAGSLLALNNADKDYLSKLHTELHDPSLLQTVPIIPPPPVFFKHTELNEGSESPWDVLRESKSPPGSYKLLSADYDWLADPRKASFKAGSEPLPDPPLELQQTRFLSRARVLLVKLRHQVDEATRGALQQGSNH